VSAAPYDPRILASRLIDAGVPVVVCRPNLNRGRPMPTDPTRTDQRELLVPSGWSTITAADCDVSGFRVGVDVLAMVGGHGVDAVDVDTKDGGNVKNLPPFQSFGLTRTPSGGWHHYVRSTGLGKISPLRTAAGHVGDYVGGTPAGGGRLLAYLPGSTRPKYPGKTYELVEDIDLDALLEHDPDDNLVGALLAHGGSREGLPGRPAVKHSEVQAFCRDHSEIPASPCHYGRAAVDGLIRDADAVVPGDPTRGRHGWAVRSATRAVELVRAGCASSVDMDALEVTLDRIKPEGGDDWAGIVGWALANADGSVGCGIHSPAPVAAPTAPSSSLSRRAALAALLDDLRTWQHLPDPAHIVVALAAAATRDDSGEPCWLLLVAAPSSGKTECVRMLDDAADEHLDEVTAAGMLGWSKGKAAKPTGVLARVGDRALVTFGDLSTLLATSDRGGRDQVFALLRRAYDGSATRDVSPPGRTEGEHPKLQWAGRLTVVAAVTGVIDRYTAHADQLGPRWVYVRLPERDTAGKRAASRKARRRGIGEHRAAASRAAAELVAATACSLPDEVPAEVVDSIEDAALVTCWGRAAVPRSGYGRREILDVPTIEEPMRVVQQITAIARGLLGLGLNDNAVAALARRVALDSMPAARRAVLAALATGEVLTTAGVARAAGVDRKVARFALEELAAVGVVCSDRSDGDEAEEPTGTVTWALAGDDGAIIAHVFAGHSRCGGWDNMWVAIPPSPPRREGARGGYPRFVPPPPGRRSCGSRARRMG